MWLSYLCLLHFFPPVCIIPWVAGVRNEKHCLWLWHFPNCKESWRKNPEHIHVKWNMHRKTLPVHPVFWSSLLIPGIVLSNIIHRKLSGFRVVELHHSIAFNPNQIEALFQIDSAIWQRKGAIPTVWFLYDSQWVEALLEGDGGGGLRIRDFDLRRIFFATGLSTHLIGMMFDIVMSNDQ